MSIGLVIRFDTAPSAAELLTLGAHCDDDELARIFQASLCHACAYVDDRIIGYVNVAWDGGVHAFLLDPAVHPDFRRRGVGRRLVEAVVDHLGGQGMQWLHVDYLPELEPFYRACGFARTSAGLIRLQLTPSAVP